ncbi:MAG: NUDIX domain-containing protein [Candidatus Kerfeldbacteria bacterium]|nr:NUDIX domain-containing protein [Candidatus Kerfeldbacteria bacterium]
MTQRNRAVPASYLILRRGRNEILLMRRKGSGYYDGWYSVPAGHVDKGELPKQCIIREMKEELGIDLAMDDVELAHTMYRTATDETGDRAEYFFITEMWTGVPKICEPKKCDDLRWFPITALPEQMIHHVRDAVGCIEKGIVYSEYTRDRIPPKPLPTLA